MPTENNKKRRPIRVAAFSGCLGDRFTGLEEAVRGEPVDVLMGDYLAELTFAMLTANFIDMFGSKAQERLAAYYCDPFVKQLAPELELISQRGIKVVTNAGAFNPRGLALAVQKEIDARNLPLKVGYVDGDNVMPILSDLAQKGIPNMDSGVNMDDQTAKAIVTANAYLGGWGITEALRNGADIVVAGRVADASLVTGPAAWWFDWKPNDWSKLAGAFAAGHVIECGPQCVGGNFCGFAAGGKRDPRLTVNLGFPIAEIEEDGSSVITKRATDGGMVTVDTVTAQFMYETQGPLYLHPDVTLHVDTVEIKQEGPDRVRVFGTQGSPPPATTKVTSFYPTGYFGVTFMYVAGLDINEKVRWLKEQLTLLWKQSGATADDELLITPLGIAAVNPKYQAECTVTVRIAASARSKEVLKYFNSQWGGYIPGGTPGLHAEFLVDRMPMQTHMQMFPGLIPQSTLRHQYTVLNASGDITAAVPLPPATFTFVSQPKSNFDIKPLSHWGETTKAAMGLVSYSRVGDKGGNANLGVWVPKPEAWDWLVSFLTEERLRELLAIEDPQIEVHRYLVPKIRGIQFVLKGYFGISGSGNTRLDTIGKSVGEFLRAKVVDIPKSILAHYYI
ncbi:hypothetical protein HDU93_002777 [Gonapodya sp. JEL0774]|nr:hypothetical protein HDU93_002777 [Gonapodya sp. JEL0774]